MSLTLAQCAATSSTLYFKCTRLSEGACLVVHTPGRHSCVGRIGRAVAAEDARGPDEPIAHALRELARRGDRERHHEDLARLQRAAERDVEGPLPEVVRAVLEPLGLTHPQYLVMLTLWDNAKTNGEPLSVKDIAGTLQMDSATLSPMLKRLQAQGLITRSRSETDERTTQVELTTKGRNLRRQALNVPPTVVERLGVELAELEHLHEVLTSINAAALAAGALDSELDR